ncbi:MAG TPA: hypothetical protein VKA74_08235, partial [Myxococcota bacterium]|nr:hypothetical protein [Myxococcota bacterium]
MIESSSSPPAAVGRPTLRAPVAIGLALLLILIFVALLFPWDSLARRLTFALERASGSRITIGEIG